MSEAGDQRTARLGCWRFGAAFQIDRPVTSRSCRCEKRPSAAIPIVRTLNGAASGNIIEAFRGNIAEEAALFSIRSEPSMPTLTDGTGWVREHHSIDDARLT